MGISYLWLYQAVAGQRRTCCWFVMGIRYVWLCQAVAVAKKDLVVVCNGYQVCWVIQALVAEANMELLVVCSGYQVHGLYHAKKHLLTGCCGYQVCGVMWSCSMDKEGWFVMGIRYVRLYQTVGGQRRTCPAGRKKKGLLVVSNGYQICEVISSSSKQMYAT